MRHRALLQILPALGALVFWVLLFCPVVGAQETSVPSKIQNRQSIEPALVSSAVAVNSAKLVEEAGQWNGRKIIFTGEVIGEHMVRGVKSWIHLNDDAYMWKNIEEGAILSGYNSGHAIWVDAGLAAKITYYGDYLHEGDIVKVLGTFNSVCREHGGDMDIHADTLEIIRIGHPIAHIINFKRALLGIGLLVVSGILFWIRKEAILRRT
jgi:hypothetical protein